MSEADDQRHSERAEEHQRNQSLEELLQELNSLLGDAERRVEETFESPRWPVVFILGPPRSGTTLLLQWLAQTGIFGYPTNLISRFYGAPYIGAKIQRLLTDPKFDFNDEFQDLRQSIDFNSTLGKTQGLLAPNEFWYFWRQFIPNEEPRHLSTEEVEQVDRSGFASSLAALEAALEKPLAMKGLILQFNLDVLTDIIQNGFIFIKTERKPLYNIQSLLEARKKYYGTKEKWYSVKPKNYNSIKDLSPEEQVAGQVHFTSQSINNQFSNIDDKHKVHVEYESFCENPKLFYEMIVDKLKMQKFNITEKYNGRESFDSTNKVKVSKEKKSKILNAWNKLSGVDL
ncbi:sulfotransferase [Salinibacter ruber]|uniref:sulfotransferase n=1 Tax=Salinibacter ruber TaxID=146919 RepID=UPI002073E435|nr:sulfotransferase [Salinibacter ruber]MCS4116158.1 hypothetical protein [Salinibacter ruber]MCS4181669.1 hypothetical protein [Salinibacter ruber]